jgi:hypothetical protein
MGVPKRCPWKHGLLLERNGKLQTSLWRKQVVQLKYFALRIIVCLGGSISLF